MVMAMVMFIVLIAFTTVPSTRALYLQNDASPFTIVVQSPPSLAGSIFFLPAVFRYTPPRHAFTVIALVG
jgi:hypothetical protein